MSDITHVLFDLFGTLVDYAQANDRRAYARSYDWLVEAGYSSSYGQFESQWDGVFEEFHRRAQLDCVEYSLDEVCRTFLARMLGRPPEHDAISALRDAYVADWSEGVRSHDDLPTLLRELATHYVLGVVSNTCHAPLVHGQLRHLGIAPLFAAIVTSVEHGKRKPSPCIFQRGLDLISGRAAQTIYVGDSYEADYLGARAAGLDCWLIDPKQSRPVPADHRLRDVFELRRRLIG